MQSVKSYILKYYYFIRINTSLLRFLIRKINDLNEKIIDQAYINYTITENNNEINIFFDNKTFDLIGWQTKDIYQNLSITLLSSIQINQKISNNLFKLPLQN